MKIFKAPLMAAMVGVSALGLSVAVPSMTQAQAGQSPVPIDVWALRNVVNAVQVSPDGKHILVHINPTTDGEYLLMIYKADDLSKPFRTLNADPMEIINAQWVSDNVILGQAWQVKRKKVNGPEDDVREYALLTYDLEANKFNQIRGSFGLENTLPARADRLRAGAAPGGRRRRPTASHRAARPDHVPAGWAWCCGSRSPAPAG